MTEPFALPEKLDTVAAPALKDMLAAAEGRQIVLDGAQVRKIGTLCAQVLLAARRASAAGGPTLTIQPSPAMEDDLRLLGLDTELLAEGDDI
ncbi:STAS domain-containing protein [Roseivivax sediminis]|uniref:Chemotaxis protein CheX n=1 Tax=Roseivivax sediminis TaxID=936889 RepID=A0A1I1XN81_9RHOB|nr:STAS domain-containing protein [Roseivivax sediminis]SFE08807.1 chemotaxis protein CheX [Roseivivax sediminis]